MQEMRPSTVKEVASPTPDSHIRIDGTNYKYLSAVIFNDSIYYITKPKANIVIQLENAINICSILPYMWLKFRKISVGEDCLYLNQDSRRSLGEMLCACQVQGLHCGGLTNNRYYFRYKPIPLHQLLLIY